LSDVTMDMSFTLSVCPRCLSWQTGTHCGDCSTATSNSNKCSKCTTISTGKFCTMCGAPTLSTLLESRAGGSGQKSQQSKPTSQPVGSHTQIIYEDTHPAAQHAPAHIVQPQRSGFSATDTKSIFGSGITPSAVVKGRSGADDDPLAKYRVSSTDVDQTVDWNQTLRSASRANVEETGNPFARLDDDGARVLNAPTQNYRAPQTSTAVPPSQSLRNVPYGNQKPKAPQVTAHNVHSNVNVIPDPTIKPSALREQGDYLEKYRVKSVDTSLTEEPVNPTVRPSVFLKIKAPIIWTDIA